MNTAPALALHEVDFSYDGRLVLEDVDFSIRAGDFVAVVGPNGSGKTTLLKLILGLLRPRRGEIRVFGEPPERARRRLGYVPQQVSHDPDFPATVTDVVRMGGLGGSTGLSASPAAALERVGLRGLERRAFAALSGGQRQRALIARALLAGSDMLLLDEPTAYVDAHGESDLQELLRELNETMTIVVVTHDLGFVSGLVNHVLCVNRRVKLHPTVGLGDVTTEILREMYGEDLRVVRHDVECPPGECRH